jgi:hypothetical protein
VCPTEPTGSPCLAPIGMAVHQPALYDLFSATLLLVVLLRLRKTPRYDGFLTLVFGAWYGTGRFIEDFFRIDETHGTGLTGSQWTAVTVLTLCLFCLVVLKDTPWKSGKGEFASVPARHRSEEPVSEEPVDAEVAAEPVAAEEPVPTTDQPKEDAGASAGDVGEVQGESGASLPRTHDEA